MRIRDWLKGSFTPAQPTQEAAMVASEDEENLELGLVGFTLIEDDLDLPLPDFSEVEAAFGGSDDVAQPPQTKPKSNMIVLSPRKLLAKLAMQSAVKGDARRVLRRATTQLVLLVVPSSQWCEPVRDFLRDTWPGTVRIAEKPRRGEETNNDWLSELSAGRSRITLVCSDIKAVTSTFLAAADLTITVPALSEVIVRSFINRIGRGRLLHADPLTLGGLDFDDVIAIVRKGRSVAEIAGALSRASAVRASPHSTSDTPELDAAISFGAARDWGLSLAADIEDVRHGQIAWSSVDRGAVVFGPPGTGKTLFARSLARYCKLPIVIASMSEFFATSDGYLGGVIKAQRKAFEQARALAPAILFLDELDALPDRATISDRGKDWWMPVITDFLLLLDSSISDRSGIIVVGATNHIEQVDSAIMRPGRLERGIYLGLPDERGLESIFRYHLGNDLIDEDLTALSMNAIGGTAAQVMEWCRGARRIARANGRNLRLEDLAAAVSGGVSLSPRELARATAHEAGHAVAAIVLGFELVSVSVAPFGSSGGRTIIVEPDHAMLTKEQIHRRVEFILAGRAAEEVLLGSPSSGAGGGERSDLKRATQALAELHGTFGLGDNLIQFEVASSSAAGLRFPEVREAVKADLRQCYDNALALITKHRHAVEIISNELHVKRFVTGGDVKWVSEVK